MKKNKKMLLALGTVATVAAPVAAVVSCGTTPTKTNPGAGSKPTNPTKANPDGGKQAANPEADKGVFTQGRRTLVSYTPESSFAGEGNRAWDMTAQASSPNSRTIFDMSMTTLFKQRVIQSDVETSDKSGYNNAQKKVEKWTLDGASNLEISNDDSTFTKVNDGEDAFTKVKAQGVKTFKFTVPSGIHYVDSQGNETKYEYHAEDYLYGFLRSLYSSEEVREQGTIKGVSTGAQKMEDSYIKTMKADQEWYPGGKLNADEFDNGNLYLLNLFGVDIKGTIDANTGASHKKDAPFILKLKETTKNTAFLSAILGNTNLFTPAPAQKIRELNGLKENATFSNPGEFLQLLEFGKAKRTNNVADLSGELSVGKYYFSQYDTRSVRDGGTGVILKKNEFGANQEYAKNDKTLLKYVTLVHGKGDEDTFAIARQKSFLQDNSESILYSSVKEHPTLMSSVKGPYSHYFASSASGAVNQGLLNPYYMVNGKQKLDDATSQLLFGANTADVNDSPTADDEYFFGRGRQFRALLNTSVNLFSFSKFASPESSVQKTSRNYELNQPISTATDTVFNHGVGGEDNLKLGTSVNSLTDQEASDWYGSHHSDKMDALKPGAKYDGIKNSWITFIQKAIAENNNLNSGSKFVFPIYDFRASDVTESATKTQAWKDVVAYLNKMTKGTNISFVEFNKDSGNKETNIINKRKTAPFLYSGAGADYPSVASLIQQHISASYGYTIGAELLKQVFSTDGLKDIDANYEEVKAYDFSTSLKTYIGSHTSEFPILSGSDSDVETKLTNITLQDWVDYRTTSLTGDKKALLDEIDNMFQGYFFSISDDDAIIREWANLEGNLNVAYKLAIGYDAYSAASTPALGNTPIGTAYAQPWVHLAQIPSDGDVQSNYVDLTIDEA